MDEIRLGKLSIIHIDRIILKQLDKIPFASIQSLNNNLRIPKTTV
jgi:hypothetical protein